MTFPFCFLASVILNKKILLQSGKTQLETTAYHLVVFHGIFSVNCLCDIGSFVVFFFYLCKSDKEPVTWN